MRCYNRRSKLPAIRSFCTIYVELVRGVPLISVLFMALFMFPLFLPQGTQIDRLLRVLAIMVPGITNNSISTFKDTWLVTIVRLYALTGSLKLAINSDVGRQDAKE